MQNALRNEKQNRYRRKAKKAPGALWKETSELRACLAGEERPRILLHQYNLVDFANIVRVVTFQASVSIAPYIYPPSKMMSRAL